MATTVTETNPSISGPPNDSEEGEFMDQPEPQSTEQVSVILPQSFELKEGEKKDVICTLEGSGEGKAMLTAIQGVKLGEDNAEGSKTKKISGKTPGDRFMSIFGPPSKQVQLNG